MDSITQFISGLPKAELHLHIEGSLEPEQMFAFAKRNDIEIPFSSIEEVRQAYQFSNLQDFLEIYYTGMNVLQTERDFFELTEAYLRRVAKDGVRHVEIFFDPQGHTDRGIEFEVVISGISTALEQVGTELGISCQLIMCFLRHLSEEAAFKTLEEAKPYLHLLSGVGLDSSEMGHPPSKFARVFALAGELGLKRVAHAGEEGPPEYVMEALDQLHVDRLDHGNRSLENTELVERLVKAQIGLTVCPLSNLKLCVVKDMQKHPLLTMLEHGLLATINSDDPAYFGGYINQNYLAVAESLQMQPKQILDCAKNSFKASFLGEQEKQYFLNEINIYAAQFDV